MHINEGKDKLALFSTKYNVLLTPHPSYSSAIDLFSLDFKIKNKQTVKQLFRQEERSTKDDMRPWIIERLDRKLADVIGSNIVEKCDVTLSRAIQPLTSDVLRVFN